MSESVDSVTAKGEKQNESNASQVASGLVVWIARHWLAFFNTAWGIYVLTPFLAPVFMHLGWYAPARMIYGVYSIFCHQLPDHSYFLFGPQAAPPLPTLEAGGMTPGLGLFQQRRFIGNPLLGYKVGICQRDVAIYGSIFVGGLIFALVRTRVKPLPLKLFLILLIPLAVDGLTQMFGLRVSNWWLRSITGAIFGFAAVFLAYPYVQAAMDEVIETETRRMT
jgi:uncharacterized membrane protein